MKKSVRGLKKVLVTAQKDHKAASITSHFDHPQAPLAIQVPPGCPSGMWAFNEMKSQPSISTPGDKILFHVPTPFPQMGDTDPELIAFARAAAAVPILYTALKLVEQEGLTETVKMLVRAAILEVEQGKATPGTIVTVGYLRALRPEFFELTEQSDALLAFTATSHPCKGKPGQHAIPVRLNFFLDAHGVVKQASINAKVVEYGFGHSVKALHFHSQPIAIHEAVYFLTCPDVRYPLSEHEMLTDMWCKWKEADGYR